MRTLARYDGLSAEDVQSVKHVTNGVTFAVLPTMAARWWGTPGSFLSRHAGLVGALGGALLSALSTRNNRAATATAVTASVSTGLAFEVLEWWTDRRVAR